MTSFNGFRGPAVRLEDIDLPRIGARIGVGEDELHAFMDVEAAGSGFDSSGRPKMLFEPHVFYRNLTGAKREQAVKAGLAYAKWRRNYPKDSYPRLTAAMKIDEAAALKACSWGLSQILGENHKMIGYATPQAMVKAFMDDEEKHLEAMVEFIISAGIDDDLREHRWATVARIYNGPGFAEHNYHGRMAYAKWRKVRDTPWTPGLPDHVIEAAAAGAVANEVATTTPIVVEPAVVIHPTNVEIPDAAISRPSGIDPAPEVQERPPSSSLWGRIISFFRRLFGGEESSMAKKPATTIKTVRKAVAARPSQPVTVVNDPVTVTQPQPFLGAAGGAIISAVAPTVVSAVTAALERAFSRQDVPVKPSAAREAAVAATPEVIEAVKQDPEIKVAINGEPLSKSVIFWAALAALGGTAVTVSNMMLSPEVETMQDWIGVGVAAIGSIVAIVRRGQFTPSK
jgi:hypothetical protein